MKRLEQLFRLSVILLLSISCCACFEREVTTELAPVTAGVASERPSYVVKKGDTLFSIAWKFDKDYKALAYYNHLSQDASLKVGQRIHLITKSPPIRAAKTFKNTKLKKQRTAAKIRRNPYSQVESKNTITLVNKGRSTSNLQWYWPAKGQVTEKFSKFKRQKGINIDGQIGSPVLASKGGIVAYSGNGLRGYGNLVILRHSNGFLSAYAFNRKILVKEGETVKEKQKIAEMGKTKGGNGRLHFEIRKKGRPIDPLKFLNKH